MAHCMMYIPALAREHHTKEETEHITCVVLWHARVWKTTRLASSSPTIADYVRSEK